MTNSIDKTTEELQLEINQLKSKNSELEKSKLQSRVWLENSPVCTKIVDLDFNLQYMSNAGVRELKINDITAFYGKPYPLPFYPDSFKIPMTKNLKRAKETGETISQEASILDIEGNTLWYHSTITPVYTDKGQLDYLMVVSLDTTKHRQTEEILRQSEATIRNKLKAITEPKGDIGTLELSDIIDVELLQSMMEDFYQLTGMLGAVLDVSGKVLVAVGWQDICTKFHRCNPDSLKNCIESDTILTTGVPAGTFKEYRCKNNLRDIVTPLIVGGKHVGNVFIGQYFNENEAPDVELFRKQAQKYGFEEKEYLAALERVPHFSRETVDAGMQFYSKLAGVISTSSYSSIQQSRLLADGKQAEAAIRKKNQEYEILNEELIQTNEELFIAKEDAEENQKLYEDLVQSSHNLIWKCDLEGKFTFLNLAWENTHGYKVEEMLGRPFSDFQRPEVFERDVIEFTKHLQGGFVKNYETTHIIKDGTEIPLIFNALPLLNSSGEIIGTQGTAFDISKLKQTELDLITTKEKLNLIINASPTGICTVDRLGNFSTTNRAYEQMVGYSKEECRSLSFFDVTHPDDRPKNKKLFQSMFSLESTGYSMEKKYIRKDGLVIDVAVHAIGIMDDEGDIRFGTAFVEDITDRKQSELNLIEAKETAEESEWKLKTALKSMTDAIFISDKEGNFIAFNEAFATFHKFSSKEECAKTLKEYPYFLDVFSTNGELVPLEMWVVPKALRGESGSNEEYTLKRKDTNETWVGSYNYSPIRNNAGNIIGSVVTARDITAKKKAEETLRESEERFELAMTASKDGLFDWNLETNEIYYSPGWKSMLGYEDHEIPNDFSSWEKLTDPRDVDRTWKMQQELIHKQRDHFEIEFKMKHKDGHWVDILSRAEAVFDENGKAIRKIGTHVDITERKLAEEQIKKNQALLLQAEEISNQGAWEWDIVHDEWTFSENWLRIHGCQISGIKREELMTIAFPEDAQEIEKAFQDALEGIAPYDLEHRIVRQNDGEVRWIKAKGNFILNDSGKRVKMHGVTQDITDMKKAEEKIRTAEKNLKNTFDLSPSIICKANLDTGYFSEASQAVTRILGYSIEEFTSKPFIEFVHPDDQQKTTNEKDDQLKGKEVTFFENRYLCKDGSYKWMAWQGTPADENGIVTAIGSDINERKLIEQEITETKQFYESIIEGVQDGIWVTDKNDVIFYANSAMEKIAGVPREQIQGNNILKDFPDETTGEFIKFYKKAKKEKKPVWYVVKVTTPARRDSWQNGWLIPQYQDKTYSGIICTIRDVTERIEAEGSVRTLSTAVEQSPSMIVITDTEGIVEYVNPTFTELTGYSSIEAIGQKSNILKSGEQDAVFYKEMWKTVDAGKVWRGQFHNKKKNGELFWESASISSILNELGDVINYIKIGEDISEFKQVENDLINAKEKAVENEEKYRLLHENAGLGIGYYTADGTVISFNSIASRDMNGVPEDFAGKSIFDIFPKESADFYFERIQKKVKSDEIEVYEDSVQLPTQIKWFLSTYTKIVNSKGEILGIQIISQDITSIKQSEVELISAKEKAEESDRLKSAFLANMSHEIRTPMNGILGFLELLGDTNISSALQQNYIRLVNRSGERLLATINDIIEISKIESGEIPMMLGNVKVYEILPYLLDIFTPEAAAKGLSLELDMNPKDVSLSIYSDTNKLEAILTNLIKNAIKFTAEGFIKFGYNIKNDKIIFFVKDSGIGVTPDRIKAIFDRFVQANLSISRGHEGSGLGLSISKAYAEMLGGKIGVESEINKGSTFYFELQYTPAKVEDEIDRSKAPQLNPNPIENEIQILIVEDDAMSYELLTAIFSGEKIKLIRAENGQEALVLFKNNPSISLILMDIKMPIMDGFETTRQIRKFDKNIPIIAQTAFALAGDKEKALALGCNDYISKPLNRTDLLSKINLYLKL